MKRFSNLPIAAKLVAGFLAVALLALAIGGIGLINIWVISNADRMLSQEDNMAFNYIGNAGMVFQQIKYDSLEMALSQDSENIAELKAGLESSMAQIDSSFKSYKDSVEGTASADLLQDVLPLWEQYKTYINDMISAAEKGSFDEVSQIILSESDQTAADLGQAFGGLMGSSTDAAANKTDMIGRVAKNATITTICVMAIDVLLALLLGFAIARSLSRRIRRLVDAADRLALGDISIDVDTDATDEIGLLMNSFGKVAGNIRTQALAVDKIAGGDFSVEIPVSSENDLMGIRLNSLVRRLNEMITSVVAATEQVAAGTRQISDAGMLISQGTTEQASSIEELSATIEEISSHAKSNAENADVSKDYTVTVQHNASAGSEQIENMLNAMDAIKESSGNIHKIIKVIDDIAFQTNILALNAAVEAARAGEYGKGFAVVADEVRALAGKSAAAASETTELIEDSISKVQNGMEIANSTAGTFGKIVSGVGEVSQRVCGISQVSDEQAISIYQMSQGLTQISAVVQTNSASAEETAAACEELLSQTEILKELVHQFKLG